MAAVVDNTASALDSFSVLGVKFSYFHSFIEKCGGKDKLQGLTTTDVCNTFVMPWTKTNAVSVTEQLQAEGNTSIVGKAEWFISHAWSYMFLDVIEAIEMFLEKEPAIAAVGDVVVWFDLFSNSQHRSDREYDWWEGAFKTAIEAIGKVLMIALPWDNPVTLRRAWCVFELYACESTLSRLELAMTKTEMQKFFYCIENENAVGTFTHLLVELRSAKSEATKPTDRDNIHAVIRKTAGGFSKIDSMIFQVLERWMLSTPQLLGRFDLSPQGQAKLNLNISQLLSAQGKPGEAVYYAKQCVAQLKGFSENNSTFLRAITNLAAIEFKLKNYSDAEELMVQCIDYSKTLMAVGAARAHANSIYNLSLFRRFIGKYDSVESLLLESIRLRSALTTDEFTLSLVNADCNLALLYVFQGRKPEAESILRKRLDTVVSSEPRNNYHVLASMNNLASFLVSQDNYDEFDTLCARILSLAKDMGIDNPYLTIPAYINQGLHKKKGEDASWDPLLVECIDFRRIISVHVTDIAVISGDSPVEVPYVEFMAPRRRPRASEHLDAWDSMNNLAVMLFAKHKFVFSEQIFVELIAIATRTLGVAHAGTLVYIDNLAAVYQAQGKESCATDLYGQFGMLRNKDYVLLK
jgi:tetratricopeptide (TPR) repeat protein